MNKLWVQVQTRLGRITSGGTFVPEVDGLRFMAITAVVMYHICLYCSEKYAFTADHDWVSRMLKVICMQGFFGVYLFFVISGFILALPFAAYHLESGPKVSMLRYYLRRLTRLEPPYILNLLICFVLLILCNDRPATELLPHLAASLVYLHNLIYKGASVLNGVTWSLEVEVQFYVLVPLLTVLFGIPSKKLRRVILIAIILGMMAIQQVWVVPQLTILQCLQFFLVGFLLADVYLTDWKRAPQKSYLWDAVSLFSWCLMVAALYYGNATRTLLPLLVFLAYVSSFRGIISNRIFCYGWIVTIGGMCYTIYLYHFLVISFIGRFLAPALKWEAMPYWLCFLIAAPIMMGFVLAFSSVAFMIFEKPFMRRDWAARVWRWLRKCGGLEANAKATS